jgi:hypothetical protein
MMMCGFLAGNRGWGCGRVRKYVALRVYQAGRFWPPEGRGTCPGTLFDATSSCFLLLTESAIQGWAQRIL